MQREFVIKMHLNLSVEFEMLSIGKLVQSETRLATAPSIKLSTVVPDLQTSFYWHIYRCIIRHKC